MPEAGQRKQWPYVAVCGEIAPLAAFDLNGLRQPRQAYGAVL